MDLAAKREEIRSDFLGREKYAPEKWKAEPSYSSRPVAFVCNDRVKLLAGDAEPVLATLAVWAAAQTPDTLAGDEFPGIARHAAEVAKTAKVTDGVLNLNRADWGAALYVAGKAGLDIVTADGLN